MAVVQYGHQSTEWNGCRAADVKGERRTVVGEMSEIGEGCFYGQHARGGGGRGRC